MPSFLPDLEQRLAAIREQGLHRQLRRLDSAQGTRIEVAGRTLVNFSSNDYLGLANHPTLKAAAIRAVEQYGAGSGAARLLCGSLAPHHELEEALAAFKGAEAALTFSSGYATALGTITALVGRHDLVIVDKLVHACLVDAARLCGATLRAFKHNDLEDLETILKWAGRPSRATPSASRILVATESVFSMDGDTAPLRELVELKDQYGAWLLVDEAHATGLYGPNRRGRAEELGVADRIEIQMGTLGKALGASGGYICGARPLIDFLLNRARSFIFSTAPVPAAAAAATAAIHLVQSAEGERLCRQLWQRVEHLRALLPAHGASRIPHSASRSAILPLIVGDEARAVTSAAKLRERGFFVPPIRYPTVARGSARLRITVTAAHTADDLARFADALGQLQMADDT
jgi:8-amino-7-oxononanoate synthase